MTRMLFPVIGWTSNWSVGALAWFFEYGDAATFARENNLYIGDPKYDRRTSGYRYTSWDIELRDLGDGVFGVAA